MHLIRFGSNSYQSVQARIDATIDDEAAGEMRKTLAAEASERRKEERRRIVLANKANKKRLLAITAKTDDGDGLMGGAEPPPWMTKSMAGLSRPGSPMRDELGAMRDLMKQRERDRIAKDNAEYKSKLANIAPTIDDDTEDDATGEARALLKLDSAQRFRAKAKAMSRRNAEYFARVRQAQPTLDTKVRRPLTRVLAQGPMVARAP